MAEIARKQDDFSTTTAMLAQSLNKVEEDARDRAQMVRDEVRTLEASQGQQIADLQTKMNLELTAVGAKTQGGFDRLNAKQREELETVKQNVDKRVQTTIQEVSDRLQENNVDIEKYVGDQIAKLREQLAQERFKNDTIIEGKNQSFTVESEKRVLDKVATILRENDGFKQDVFEKLQQQLTETQKLYRDTKEERMLYDSKLQ